MRWFMKKEDPAEKLLSDLLTKLRKREFDIIVFDRKQIKKRYGPGLFRKLLGDLAFLQHKKLLFICRVDEPRISWVSDDYPDRIIINLVRSPGTPEFQKSLREAIGEMLELESIINDSKLQKV